MPCLRGTTEPVSAFGTMRTKRIAVTPDDAGHTAAKMLTAVVDFQEGLFAFTAGVGHRFIVPKDLWDEGWCGEAPVVM